MWNDEIGMLGLDSTQNYHSLNLAGGDGWPPDARQLARNSSPMSPAIEPDYELPDMEIPAIRPYDLQLPAITHMPEFSVDPALPDLDAYNKPYSVDIMNAQSMEPTPEYRSAVPTEAEISSSLYPGLGFPMLDVHHGIKDVDPALPDLQHPELTPQVRMPADERPGALAPQAVDMLHADAHFQQTSGKAYPTSQMDAHGMNDTRARHMALLTDGLDK